MINVNKITSTLAKLPDAQLQQYAQMHKSDPYIMALAMTESNRRKELRAAKQAPAQQEQPKVVDQEIASMASQQLPEDQGIARIPAGDMNFAGGGIIAFAGGGGVERYQSQGLVEDVGGMGGSEIMSAAGTAMPYTGRSLLERVVSAPEEPEWKQRLRAEQEIAARTARATPATTAPAAEAQEPSAPSAPAAAPSALREGRTPVADRSLTMGGPTSLDALQEKYFGSFDQRSKDINTQREGLVQGIKDLTAANLADTQEEALARSSDVVYKGREARLAKQEKEIEGMGDKYLGLALLQAGAAMMSTPGGLAAAIGKGAVVGADRYAAGLEKINAAQSKFAEARDRLDDLRLNRDDMNAKEIRAAKKEFKAADLKGQELLLSGAEKDWGIERDMLGKLFTAANEDLQTTRRIQAQKETAGRQDTNEKMRAAVLADLQAKYPNDPTKVAAEYNKTLAKATTDPMALYNQELAKTIAEEEVKLAKMGDAVMPGQREKLQALKNQLGGGRATTPPPNSAQVAALKANPNMAVEFDRKFGPGASAQYLK